MHVCKKEDIFRHRRLNHNGMGEELHGEDALSKLSHTVAVCVTLRYFDLDISDPGKKSKVRIRGN